MVEAVSHELRAYTVLIKSDLVMLTKTGRGNALGFVADRKTGEPIGGVQISAMTRNGSPRRSRPERRVPVTKPFVRSVRSPKRRRT